MKFVRIVEQFINRHHLIDRADTVIVGLSGGADSVALLTVLCNLNYNVVATHCNFHLRGEESMRDEAFCRKLCSDRNVRLLVRNFDVDSRRREAGESLEMACRALRYDWWRSLLKENVGSVIAVGHHREDNIETFFLNLFRGSSLTGLKGMLPRNELVVRPLLECKKSEILAYLRDHHLKYVTDSTNADNYYKRNRIRNRLMPLISDEFPGAIDSVAQTIGHLADNYGLYRDFCRKLRDRYVDADGVIDLSAILENESYPRMVLFEILSDYGFNMSQVENIMSGFDGTNGETTFAGKTYHGRSSSYFLDRGKLVPLDDLNDGQNEVTVDLNCHPFETRRMTVAEFTVLKNARMLRPEAMYADSGIMLEAPEFIMRGWRTGDRMRPFGLKGSKLLSDLFSNAKLSLNEKKGVKVILRNSDIIWIPGVRCSALFPVTDKTEEVIEITYKPLRK